jgi:hypothetical protein
VVLATRALRFDFTAERSLRGLAALYGIAGPLALTVYFAAPAFSTGHMLARRTQLSSYALGQRTSCDRWA